MRFTDERRYFVSEARVYRLLKDHDLITCPAFVAVKAANEFHTKTVRYSEMWQTDVTYFKIICWGWMYLSTVLDDFSRYIFAWKLYTNMRAEMSPIRSTSLACLRLRQRHRTSQAAPAIGQWSELHRV